MFTIPRNIFGEKIKPLSVYFYDTSLDDNVIIHDDGYQNLNAGFDLFSKVQEIRTYVAPTGSNQIMPGSASCSCLVYDDIRTSASGDDGGMSYGFVYGSLNYRIENDNMGVGSRGGQIVGFDSGVLFETIVPMPPVSDSGSVQITFYSGSIFDQIVWSSGSQDTASVQITFYSGSIFNEITATSGSDTSSIFIGYEDGYIADVAVETPTRYAYQTMSIAFLNGTSSVVSASIGYATSSNGTIVPHP
jgi:hypothetical protein